MSECPSHRLPSSLSNAAQGHCSASRATDKWAWCGGCVDVGSAPRVTQYCNNWPSVASSKEILGPLNGRLPSMPSQRNSIPGPEAPQRRAYGASPRGRARDGVREHVPPRVWVLGKTLNCLVKCSKSQKPKMCVDVGAFTGPVLLARRVDAAVLPSVCAGRRPAANRIK